MQYATSMPAAVQVATVPAAPKSTSSGCAVTTSTRVTSVRTLTDRRGVDTDAPYDCARAVGTRTPATPR